MGWYDVVRARARLLGAALGPDRICGGDSGPLHGHSRAVPAGGVSEFRAACLVLRAAVLRGRVLPGHRQLPDVPHGQAPSRYAGRQPHRRAAPGWRPGHPGPSGAVFAQLLIVLAAALSYGLWMAALLRSLSPVPPPERQARQRMAERLRARGYDVSVS